ncbi:MAG: hypothetical protein ACLT2T_11995 [Bilophila wadsworthia]
MKSAPVLLASGLLASGGVLAVGVRGAVGLSFYRGSLCVILSWTRLDKLFQGNPAGVCVADGLLSEGLM